MKHIAISIEYAGLTLPVVKNDAGVDCVPLKPLCDLFGLKWETQRVKVGERFYAEYLGICTLKALVCTPLKGGADDQFREHTFLRLDRVAAFMMTVNPDRVRANGNEEGAAFLQASSPNGPTPCTTTRPSAAPTTRATLTPAWPCSAPTPCSRPCASAAPPSTQPTSCCSTPRSAAWRSRPASRRPRWRCSPKALRATSSQASNPAGACAMNDEKLTEAVGVKLSDTMLRQVRGVAEANDTTPSEWIRATIEAALRKEMAHYQRLHFIFGSAEAETKNNGGQ